MLVGFFALLGTEEGQAQRNDEMEYNYADVNSGVIYQLYFRFKGYQVQVWMKNNKQTKWSECTVTNTNNDVISFKFGATQYHAKLDPNNTDAVVLYNGNYSQQWKYYLKQ